MTRYTVNLSRARSFSRRKRASKAMKILREKVEEREDADVSIAPEVNSRLWENGVERPPGKLEIEVENTDEGVRVKLPTETGKEKEEAAEEQEEDYSEIIDGTVSEAKEAIEGIDDPDYEELLEAEKNSKDRKTLKEWIENRM